MTAIPTTRSNGTRQILPVSKEARAIAQFVVINQGLNGHRTSPVNHRASVRLGFGWCDTSE